MPTESAAQALSILRDGSLFQWYVIPLFALVVYVYANEIEKRNWGLVFHFTQYAPVWGAPGKTAYLILIGLNIEICFMFAIAGITFAKMLPPDRKVRILGLPNRLFIAVTGAAFCVFVEVLLNAVGALTWDYPWWSAGAPWLIFVFGYLTFFLVSFWVFDMPTIRKKMTVLGVIYGVDILALLVFGVMLRWI